MSKDFKAYPIRHVRLSDEEWEKLKVKKTESGKTWNNFIKDLIKQTKERKEK